MRKGGGYGFEYAFLGVVIALSVAGFWNVFLGARADPDRHQVLHLVTNFAWLALLAVQLRLVDRNARALHRSMGLLALLVAPVLVATTALLSVHSAHEGLVSGRGDFLIVQNVMVTLELALLIVLAFVFRKRRTLHASFLMGSALLFMGIALFFTLTSFVPGFRIEGPETFDRFGRSATAVQGVSLAVGLAFFARDVRNGWPMLFAGACFVLNELLRWGLEAQALIGPLTEAVGSMDPGWTFVAAFVLVLGSLLATGVLRGRMPAGAPVRSSQQA